MPVAPHDAKAFNSGEVIVFHASSHRDERAMDLRPFLSCPTPIEIDVEDYKQGKAIRLVPKGWTYRLKDKPWFPF